MKVQRAGLVFLGTLLLAGCEDVLIRDGRQEDAGEIARKVIVPSCGCNGVIPVNLGVNVQSPALMDKARAANLGWVRGGIAWRDVEPSQGFWVWTDDDNDVRDAKARGLKVLMILGSPPLWAGGGPNHNTPSLNLAWWEEYVRRVAQRYNGVADPLLKVDAYEIWNEPDLEDSGPGIGWKRRHDTAPFYVDYVHTAAVQIRTHAPGTKVVAGAFSAGDSEDGYYTRRMKEVAAQFERTWYPDGHASSFVDVISLHANGKGSEYSDNTTDRAKFRIDDINGQNPTNACKPKWITEYGFQSGIVGEVSQRDRIRRMTEMFAGTHYGSNCGGFTRGTHRVENAFIYVQVDFPNAGTWGIHRVDQSPKPVVTQYLQYLPFPASDY
jgi:hypothetical protein